MAYARAASIDPSLAARPQTVAQFVGDTTGEAGFVTAPGAGATIVTLTPGYTSFNSNIFTAVFQVLAGYGLGTPVAADLNNMQLVVDGTVVSALALPALVGLVYFTFVLTMTSSQAISVQAIGAGTAGVAYVAGLYPSQMK